ncbi:MAG: SUMF1/EgtB/PvdO family nonheme iron enzyme [Pseudomonadota bacterium]
MMRGTRYTLTTITAFLCLASWSLASASDDFSSPELVEVPAGAFVMGSDTAEREMAYRLDEAAYGHSVTRERGWYDHEPQKQVNLDQFSISKNLVTNADYALFLKETEHTPPTVTREEWDGYGLIHPFERAVPYIWQSSDPPDDRHDHPVVMVSHTDAKAYAAWLSERTGQTWRLPSEAEWEKAARGTEGAYFPWGNQYDAKLLNSHDAGPFSTLPVGSFPDAASPYGMLDAAGQVFEWTSTPAGNGRHIVKGGSWDDKGCGVCRPAARHSRPDSIKHILVGFRLIKD